MTDVSTLSPEEFERWMARETAALYVAPLSATPMETFLPRDPSFGQEPPRAVNLRGMAPFATFPFRDAFRSFLLSRHWRERRQDGRRLWAPPGRPGPWHDMPSAVVAALRGT